MHDGKGGVGYGARLMADDLFSSAAEDALAAGAPLAARLRPRTLDDIVGQEHLLGAGCPLRTLVEADRLSSVILWGPPGTGKTTLAQAIAAHTSKEFEQLSAVRAGVKDVRDTLERARHRLGERGQGTILFLDEVHRFNKAQQDALLPAVESGLLVLVGATTENPFFEVNPPLRSRSTLFRLEPLDDEAVGASGRAVSRWRRSGAIPFRSAGDQLQLATAHARRTGRAQPHAP
jgi:putative ATPase